MSVNWSALLTASLVIFSVHKGRYCYGLEWNAQSLLQPGPCPTPLGSATSFDVQQVRWAQLLLGSLAIHVFTA